MKKLFFLFILAVTIVPIIGLAQTPPAATPVPAPATTPYAPTWLVDFSPGSTAAGQDTFSAYINILYVTSISLAALLAVVKIIIAGAKYMLSDIVSSKGDAIKDIQGSLFGLLLIICAVFILNVINPRLVGGGVGFTRSAEPAAYVPTPLAPRPPTPTPGTETPPTGDPDTTTNPAVGRCNPIATPTQGRGSTIFVMNLANCNKIQRDPALNNLTPFAYYTRALNDQCKLETNNVGYIEKIGGTRDEYRCTTRSRETAEVEPVCGPVPPASVRNGTIITHTIDLRTCSKTAKNPIIFDGRTAYDYYRNVWFVDFCKKKKTTVTSTNTAGVFKCDELAT